MLKIKAIVQEAKYFRQIQSRETYFQWVDVETEDIRILCSDPDPWEKEYDILFRREQSRTRAGIISPKRLNLLCFPPVSTGILRGELVRDICKGRYVHSESATLLFFAFPSNIAKNRWVRLSVF